MNNFSINFEQLTESILLEESFSPLDSFRKIKKVTDVNSEFVKQIFNESKTKLKSFGIDTKKIINKKVLSKLVTNISKSDDEKIKAKKLYNNIEKFAIDYVKNEDASMGMKIGAYIIVLIIAIFVSFSLAIIGAVYLNFPPYAILITKWGSFFLILEYLERGGKLLYSNNDK